MIISIVNEFYSCLCEYFAFGVVVYMFLPDYTCQSVLLLERRLPNLENWDATFLRVKGIHTGKFPRLGLSTHVSVPRV